MGGLLARKEVRIVRRGVNLGTLALSTAAWNFAQTISEDCMQSGKKELHVLKQQVWAAIVTIGVAAPVSCPVAGSAQAS